MSTDSTCPPPDLSANLQPSARSLGWRVDLSPPFCGNTGTVRHHTANPENRSLLGHEPAAETEISSLLGPNIPLLTCGHNAMSSGWEDYIAALVGTGLISTVSVTPLNSLFIAPPRS